jgi:hypothetical protein
MNVKYEIEIKDRVIVVPLTPTFSPIGGEGAKFTAVNSLSLGGNGQGEGEKLMTWVITIPRGITL